MDSFIGTINAKIDVKGRVFIPVTFRKILYSSGETRFILRKDVYQECLILYPESVWKEKINNLQERLNEWDDEEQHLYRRLSRFVEMLELDSSGRVLIPKKYLQMAKISKAVCFLGMNTSIELWDPDQLDKSMMTSDEMKMDVKRLLGSKPVKEKSD